MSMEFNLYLLCVVNTIAIVSASFEHDVEAFSICLIIFFLKPCRY